MKQIQEVIMPIVFWNIPFLRGVIVINDIMRSVDAYIVIVINTIILGLVESKGCSFV